MPSPRTSHVIATVLVLCAVVLVPLGYRALYRSLEWHRWVGPRPIAGGHDRGWPIEVYANRFTNETITYLYNPTGSVALVGVMNIAPSDGRTVVVSGRDGAAVFIDDAHLHDALMKKSPRGFGLGKPVPDKFYQLWPKLRTDYSSLPAPGE